MEKTYAILLLIALAWLVWKGLQAWRAYRSRLHLKLEAVPPGGEEARNPELPGRARVVPRVGGEGFSPGITNPGLRVQRPVFPAVDPGAERLPALDVIVVGADRHREEPEPQPRVPEPAPQRVEIPVPVEPPPQVAPEEVAAVFTPDADPPLLMEREADVVPPAPAAMPEEPPAVSVAEPEPVAAAPSQTQQDMFAGEPLTVPAARRDSVAARASALYETGELEPVDTLGRGASQQKVHEEVQDVIALHVIAHGPAFHGEELLRCILSYGLRFGEMSIFHRHEKPTGQGLVLFSMAKAVEPGTFDLEGMTRESIPGVSFFQSLPGVNSIHAFDIMVDTARRLAAELDGEVLDQQQNPLTRQLIEHYRERVTEFERRRLMERR